MRVLYTASCVILLVDILTKQPIKNAVIFFNEQTYPYVSKDSGHYVFCNLYPGNYKVSILAEGYVNEEIETEIEFGESKRFVVFMSFKSNNEKILKIPRIEFLISKNNEIVKNQKVKIKLNSISTPIKLVQKPKKEDQELVLNIPENNSFIFQNYLYSVQYNPNLEKNKEDEEETNNEEGEKDEKDEKNNKTKSDENKEDTKNNENLESDDNEENNNENEENNTENKKDTTSDESNDNERDNSKLETINKELLFLGYDRKNNAYILDEILDEEIPLGGKFYPFWNLRTDNKGKITLPFFSKIMGSAILNFEVILDKTTKSLEIKLENFDKNVKVLNVEICL